MMPTSPTSFTMDHTHGASKRWTRWILTGRMYQKHMRIRKAQHTRLPPDRQDLHDRLRRIHLELLHQRSIPANHGSRRMSMTNGKKQVKTDSGGYELQRGLDSPTLRISTFNDSHENITHAL
jgi:hypothetical protein